MKKFNIILDYLKKTAVVLSILLLLWMITSFVDVNIHNDIFEAGQMASWNIFNILF